MKTKEQTVHDMCFTMRHDYGLDKDDLPEGYPIDFCSGMTGNERKILHMQMSQLYDQHIAPLQQIIDDTLKVLPVGHIPSHTQVASLHNRLENLEKLVEELQKDNQRLEKNVDNLQETVVRILRHELGLKNE